MSCSRHIFWQWPLAAGAFSGVTFSEPCAASFLWIAIATPAAPVRSPSLMFVPPEHKGFLICWKASIIMSPKFPSFEHHPMPSLRPCWLTSLLFPPF
ncbi:hypothetical protein WJX79_006913 [Trebouxia sp. C0005]